MQHLQHGLVNKHMMTSIPEKSREKAWRFSCQNQEMLLIRRCERCKQSTNAQDRGISHSHSIIYSSRSGCMQAAAQHPVSHPGELSQRFLNMAKTEGPLSSGGPSLWRLMPEQRMHSTLETHNAALSPIYLSSPGHEMVCMQTSNEYLRRHSLQKGSVCGEQ